jgi:hypothetical protein
MYMYVLYGIFLPLGVVLYSGLGLAQELVGPSSGAVLFDLHGCTGGIPLPAFLPLPIPLGG